MRSVNMKFRHMTAKALSVIILLTYSLPGQSSSFNFQGRLNVGGTPANGHYDLQFRLYDAVEGGNRVGPIAQRPNTVVINGVFSTVLSFGNTAFRTVQDRFIEISVRPTGTQNEYVVLGARQQILTVPFAMKASLADYADIANTATDAENSASLGGVAASGYARLNFPNTGTLQVSGNAGFGTSAPNTRLTLSGGAPWTSSGWTASMNIQNASALGWEANGSGQRFGIGQTNNGLHFFRTISGFGSTLTPAQYDMVITDNGNVTQPVERHGLAKAMVYVNPKLPADQYIVRCYNGTTDSSSGNCGFTVTRPSTGRYFVNFGFAVGGRFLSVTAESGARNASAQAGSATSPVVEVQMRTIIVNPGLEVDDTFYLIVY